MQNPERQRSDDELVEAAKNVLDANWTGRSTVPSPSLYPHQWSWDSAFIAVGLSWYRQDRAQHELESLLAAQWADGRVPHIVFNSAVPADAYFPGPDFWDSADAAGSPQAIATSGLIQPPLHARAALEVYEHAEDRSEAIEFLRRVYPELDAWHRYLVGRRDPDGIGLAAILHPWESGLDNSPTWEGVLGELQIPAGVLPPYRRSDLAHADPADRPTAAAYDRFVHLVSVYRALGYDDVRICEFTPFVVVGPLVNALLVWSSLALAAIARLVDDDPEPHLRLAATVRAAIEAELWDPDHGRYYIRDLRRGTLVRDHSILSFTRLSIPTCQREASRPSSAILRLPHFILRRGPITSWFRAMT